jgi:hypothetical protein
MTPQPIDPDDIRVGDTVQVIDVATVTVDTSDLTAWIKYPSHHPWTRSWELVDRPSPKPKVGQHWLSPNGNEYICVDREGLRFFLPLRGSGYEPAPALAANVAPDGWKPKP